MRVKPSIEPTEYRQLRTTILTLGFEATLSWSTQSINPPDTNVAHYPRLMYYYHPDYLGHVEYITDLDGLPPALSEVEVYQHFYYTAWGETLLEQKANRPGMNFDSPYRFNGKELDEETGLYYYGARYYNPVVSVWLGVDPLASKFPHQSPYVFTDNNPIMLWDPTGMAAEEANGGGFWNKLGNFFIGNGWKTSPDIEKIVSHTDLNEITIVTTKDDNIDYESFGVGAGSSLATQVKGAAELTQAEIIVDSQKHGKVAAADKNAFKSLGKIATAAKWAGNALGVVSMAGHISHMAEGFKEAGLKSSKGWLNVGKVAVDIFFMSAKLNPLVATLSVAYNIADSAGYLK